jgi:hypothetical protein
LTCLSCAGTQVCYPKPTDKPLYNGLVTQCKSLGLPFVSAEELLSSSTPLKQRHDLVIDALFGFSFKGAPRPPFDGLLQVRGASTLRTCCSVSNSTKCCVPTALGASTAQWRLQQQCTCSSSKHRCTAASACGQQVGASRQHPCSYSHHCCCSASSRAAFMSTHCVAAK